MSTWLKIPYTRFLIFSNIISFIFYIASSSIIWLMFKKTLDFTFLLSIDNIWSPLAVSVVGILCNKWRDKIIDKIVPLTILYFIMFFGTDWYLFFVNELRIENYILQTITEITVLQLYCYAVEGFQSKVFFEANTFTSFRQWCQPYQMIAVFVGGLISTYVFSKMSLRFLIVVQLTYDLVWFILTMKSISIGKKMLLAGERI